MSGKSKAVLKGRLAGTICAMLLVIGGLALSGCSKAPITGDKFTSTVESFGYETVDVTDRVDAAVRIDNPEFVELALVSRKGATGIVFYEFSDDVQARIFYDKEESLYDILPNSSLMSDGPDVNVEEDSGSIAYHELQFYQPDSKKYIFNKVSLKGNVVITAFAENGSEETERVLKKLGY